MAFLLQLLAICIFATVMAVPPYPKFDFVKILAPSGEDSSYNKPIEESDLPEESPTLALNLELPRVAAPSVPFYAPEPSSELKAPSQFLVADYNSDYPVPSQDLQVPSLTAWNPNNDPKFYYEIPVLTQKQESPTNLYPKKYNKEANYKGKPISGRPKEELVLQAITEEDFLRKQHNSNKLLLNSAKRENQRQNYAEKTQ